MARFLAVAALVFAADRLSKWWIVRSLDLGESVPLLPGVFHLTYVENSGAAFSLFPQATPLLAAVNAVVVVGVAVYAARVTTPWLQVVLGLIAGGGLGNLVDRVGEGVVVDFLDFRIWPVFNLADTAVVIGVIVFGLYLLRREEAPAP